MRNPMVRGRAAPRAWPPELPIPIPDGCVLYYLMVESEGGKLRDISPYGNDGTLVGGTWMAVPGGVGSDLYQDGVDDQVNCGNPAQLAFGTGSFAVELWFYPTSNVAVYDTLLWKGGNNTATIGFDFELGSGNWTLNLADGTTTKQAQLSATTILGRYTHILMVVDRGINKLIPYLDGVAQSAGIDISTLGSVSGVSALTLGSRSDGSYRCNGHIGLVRLYNRSLMAVEVEAAYREWAWRFGRPI